MGRKILETLTESMFYVLMALLRQARCGTEIADFVAARTKSRVRLGPGTLYTILAKFEEVGLIRETAVEGRKVTFEVHAYDERGEIGSGVHERFIIHAEKFMAKTQSKLEG